MLASINPTMSAARPGQSQFQAANLCCPSPSPTGLNSSTTLLSSAALWRAQGLELIRHMLQSQTHENSNTPSQSVTSFSLYCRSCRNLGKVLQWKNWRSFQLYPDALALQFVECVSIKHTIIHAHYPVQSIHFSSTNTVLNKGSNLTMKNSDNRTGSINKWI